ncbi:sigma 54-interacting transcriptional regulator [Vibrio sp.]|nr:sigma 54-interacting transcriptional regulator [Vibrio sp.]
MTRYNWSIAKQSMLPVFLSGEQGTPKKEVLYDYHLAASRDSNLFIVLNSGLLNDSDDIEQIYQRLLSFVKERLEQQSKGTESNQVVTLVIPHIQNLSLNWQKKWHALMDTPYLSQLTISDHQMLECQLVLLCDGDVQLLIEGGQLLPELLYGCFVHHSIPSLQAERKCLPNIIVNALKKLEKKLSHQPARLSSSAINSLGSHYYTYNHKELISLLHRISIQYQGQDIPDNTFIDRLVKVSHSRDKVDIPSEFALLRPLHIIEREIIEKVIEECDGNVPMASRYLEVSPSTLYRKVQNWKENE